MRETFFYRGTFFCRTRTQEEEEEEEESANEDKGEDEAHEKRGEGMMKTLPPSPPLDPSSTARDDSRDNEPSLLRVPQLSGNKMSSKTPFILRGFLWRRLINEASAISGCWSSLVEKFRRLVSHVAPPLIFIGRVFVENLNRDPSLAPWSLAFTQNSFINPSFCLEHVDINISLMKFKFKFNWLLFFFFFLITV